MRILHNVERLGFRKGEYVGYSNEGVWKITVQGDGSWRAVCNATGRAFTRWRLADVSERLDELSAD